MADRGGGPRLISSGKAGPPQQLQSWKEIASYLGRDERTVRRWEKSEGLPIHRLQHGKSGSVFANAVELDAWREARSDSSRKSRPAPASNTALRSRRGLVVVPAIALLIVGLWIGFFYKTRSSTPATITRLTSDPGIEEEPSLSPDGQKVAYVWNGPKHENFDIYVMPVAGRSAIRLTTNAASDYSPAWSPDGASIAFMRQIDTEKAAVFIVPARGGAERMVAEFRAGPWLHWDRPGRFLAWSPDGKWLVAVGRLGPEYTDRLLRIAPASGEMRPLTSPNAASLGEAGPAISPDGKLLAFSRRLSWSMSALCLLPLSPNLIPAGEVRQLDTGSSWNTSPAWMPDGRALIFSAGMMDSPHLAKIAISGAAGASRLAGVEEYGWQPTLASTTGSRVRLVYTQHFESVNIWRKASADGSPSELITSAHWSFEPDYSLDGKRIAFLSDRSGFSEVWVADADGNNPQQWTFLRQPSLGAPRWSPDGQIIAFTAPGDNGSSIQVLDGPGAAPRPVPGSHHCGYIAWSRDQRALYFSSNRGGSTQIWKIAPQGGEAVRVTTAGGRVPAVSADGRYLYYLRLVSAAGDQQLFRVSIAGGNEERMLDFVDAYSLSAEGIAFKYYRPAVPLGGPYLRLLRFRTGQVEPIATPSKPLRYGLAISPDGRSLLYSQVDFSVTDLMLVDALQ